MYDDVLIPTDGTDAVEAAIEHGFGLARTYDATVHALYVVDETESGAEIVGTGAGSDTRTRYESDGRDALDALVEEGDRRDVPVSTTLVEGTPHKLIAEYAAEYDVDVIVMGTHGRSGLSRFLSGSVTERVIRTTDVPVFAVQR